jgi:hypothetical protein
MPALNSGNNQRFVPSKPAPKPPPGKNIGPTRQGIRSLPMPKAQPKSTPIKAGIPKTFEGAPKVQKAYQKLPKAEPYKASHHGGGIGGLLEGAGGAVLGAAPGIIGALAGQAAGPIAKPIAQAVATKAEAVGKVALKEPIGLTERTAREVPSTLNAMVVGPARVVGEEALSALHSKFPGLAPAHVLGVHVGKPGEAAGEVIKTAAGEYVGKNARYGKGLKAEEQALKHRGVLPEATDLAVVAGPAIGAAGRALSKTAATSGRGAEAFAKVDAFREATTHALQAPNVQEFLRRKDQIPTQPTPAEYRRAAVHESAAKPRPNLRQSSGSEPTSIKRGAAVAIQRRSSNLFHALGQTKLDNLRRDKVQQSLERVMNVRKDLENHPGMSHEMIPQDSFASQLAYDVRRGEVAPLLQRGGVGRNAFLGAEKAQRIGAAYGKGQNVKERRGVSDAYGQTFHDNLKNATPQQKKVLAFAKEGMLDLHDPVKATRWLQEIHDQAVAGADRISKPLQHVKEGSSVARETQSVLDHIAKHGPESVFTPQFARLVQTIPDERLVSPKDPVLQQNPDAAIARKYLPQMQMLKEWAERHPNHPDAPATQAAVAQIHDLLEQGHDLRQNAIAAHDPTQAHTTYGGAPAPSETPIHDVGGHPSKPYERPKPLTQTSREALDQLDKVRGKPNGKVRIYRATSGGQINPGDWVTLSPTYAEQMLGGARARTEASIISHDVPAKDVRMDANTGLAEQGYHGPPLGEPKTASDMHASASDKFATAKNLADELAQKHGLPTDRAYIPHQKTLGNEAGLHTIGNVSPTDYKRWSGQLQAAGYRSTDAELILRGILKSIRNKYTMDHVNAFAERHAVKLPRDDMTTAEATKWLAESGRNPDHFQVVHLGKLRNDITDLGGAEHLLHLNSDPEAHAKAIEKMWQQAGDTPLTDTTKGASIIPKAAFEEARNSFRGKNAFGRVLGKTKGEISKLILGLSAPWLTTMSAVTYPVQSLMGGAGPIDAMANFKYYRSLNPVDKASFDSRFGVDSPMRTTSHGMEAERMGSQMPQKLDGLVRTMRVMRQSPMGRLLSKGNLVKAVISAERVPRRYARINVAMKGVKSEALRQIASDMQDGQKAMNAFEQGTQRLMHVGRLPAKEYIQKAMENTKAMEEVARHANNAMGEWHNMTNFERNQLSKYVMFYPWMRYSLNLAAHTLPAHHPLLYASALKLGTWEHKSLTELLGTEPEPGNVYLGKAQPNVPPAKREFSEVGIKQANPTLNTAMTAIAGKPSELLDVLPPYFTSALEWATNKALFTDKPLKGSRIGESKEGKESPQLLPFMAEQNLVKPFGVLRALEKVKTEGRPQAAGSLPLFPGGEKRVQYSNKIERQFAKERAKEPGLPMQLAQELVPLIPHPADRLAYKIETEKREAKESKKVGREEKHRREKEARKEKGGPQVSSNFLP